jgi:predicted RNase H-like nuclease (RuvC/YqgF family)
LLKKHFEDIIECENLPYPEKGSGVNGRVLVVDLATAVVNSILDDLDEETRKNVLASLTKAKAPEELEEDESVPLDLLKVVSNLDIENKEQFRKVTEAATKLLEKRMEREKEEEIKKRVQEAKMEAMEKNRRRKKRPGDQVHQTEVRSHKLQPTTLPNNKNMLRKGNHHKYSLISLINIVLITTSLKG